MGESMSNISKILCLIVIALQFPSIARAEETSIRRYQLPGHGILELAVPKSWKQEVRRPMADLPPTIIFSPNAGDEFTVMITPLWNLGGIADFNSDKKIKDIIDKDRQKMAPGAVEKELVVHKIKGPAAYGYYFMATDKAPGVGEWEYAIRAGVATGDLLLSITVLTHKKESEAVSDALEMLRNLRQVK
jgi:hypothetical protein